MARRPRIHYPGAVYHVIARGVEKRRIFLDEEDYARYIGLQKACLAKFRARLIAYCLMPNHTHLLVKIGSIRLSRIMHKILFPYASAFNEKYGRIGHLFQGRHFAYLVTHEAYFQNLIRYIHQNPVRAKLVSRPKDWRWSSCTDDPREEDALPADFDPYNGESEELNSLTRLEEGAPPDLDQLAASTVAMTGIGLLELRSRIKRQPVVLAKRVFAREAASKGIPIARIAAWLGLTDHAVARYL